MTILSNTRPGSCSGLWWKQVCGLNLVCVSRCGSSCSSAPRSGGPSVTRWTCSWWWSARRASGASHHAPVCGSAAADADVCGVFQYDRPVSHDHVGSDAAAVCGGSRHAVLPLHLQVHTIRTHQDTNTLTSAEKNNMKCGMDAKNYCGRKITIWTMLIQ